jgi:8-oxo-dGTP diphosphatase
MLNLTNVTCAIIIKENKILVAQRSEKMILPLKWEFPGGKLEKDEDEASCVKREVREEINIEIEIIKKLSNTIHDYGNFKIKLIPFLANYISGEIILLEHSNYKFVGKNELYQLDWAEADIPIVEELLKMVL